MEKIVSRKSVKDDLYQEIFKKEKHDHELIKDEEGTLRWKANPSVRKLVDKISLNDLWALFDELGLNRNSEIIRKMYRDMGYPLFGYWEIFHWETNNEIADEYKYIPLDYKPVKKKKTNGRKRKA